MQNFADGMESSEVAAETCQSACPCAFTGTTVLSLALALLAGPQAFLLTGATFVKRSLRVKVHYVAQITICGRSNSDAMLCGNERWGLLFWKIRSVTTALVGRRAKNRCFSSSLR